MGMMVGDFLVNNLMILLRIFTSKQDNLFYGGEL